MVFIARVCMSEMCTYRMNANIQHKSVKIKKQYLTLSVCHLVQPR